MYSASPGERRPVPFPAPLGILALPTPTLQPCPPYVSPRHRNDLNDLCARGDAAADDDAGGPVVPAPRPWSRIRPPRMLGVFAQKAHIYTEGSVFLLMLMHRP